MQSGQNINIANPNAVKRLMTPGKPMLGNTIPIPVSGSKAPVPGSLPFVGTAPQYVPNTATIPTSTNSIPQPPKRKKRRRDEHRFPEIEQITDEIPESALFMELLNAERRLDALLHEKKMRIKDSFQTTSRNKRTLKLTVFNTYENQRGPNGALISSSAPPSSNAAQQQQSSSPKAGHNGDAASNKTPSWQLKIQGYLVPDERLPYGGKGSQRQFTSFFSKMIVEIDKNVYPNEEIVEWHRKINEVDSDGFSIERNGHRECNIKIILQLHHDPPVYKVSSSLQKIINVKTESLTNVLSLLWNYIKFNHLQDPKERRIINADHKLKEAFNVDRLTFTELLQLTKEHLSLPDPIEIDYHLKLSGEAQDSVQQFEIEVDVEDTSHQQTIAILENNAHEKEVQLLDSQIVEDIAKINEHKEKREFFLGFSANPVEFIHQLIASQTRDLKIAKGGTRDKEDSRHYSYYHQPLVQEAVSRYLEKREHVEALGYPHPMDQ